MLEDLVLPPVGQVVEVDYGQEASEQCSILTEDLHTIECSYSESTVSFSDKDASSPADFCHSDILVVDYPDKTPQAALQYDDPNTCYEQVVAEPEEEGKVELASMNEEAPSDPPSERAVVITKDGAVAGTVKFEPEHVSELRPELNWRPQPCSRQAEHMLEERLWRECKICRAMLRKLAVQLAQSS